MEEIFKGFPDIVSRHEMEKMLGVGRNQSLSLLQNKKIKSMRVGNRYKIPKSYVIQYIYDKCENKNND